VILKVGPIEVEMRLDPELTASGDFGRYDPVPSPVVRIAPGLPARIEAMTALHEMIHHIDEANGMQLREWQTRVLEQALAGLVVDNPLACAGWFRAILAEVPSGPASSREDGEVPGPSRRQEDGGVEPPRAGLPGGGGAFLL
jgi:hypothetical protein